jgi:hypothetical protein
LGSLGINEHIKAAKDRNKRVIVFPIFTDGIHDSTQELDERDCTDSCKPGSPVFNVLRENLYRSCFNLWKKVFLE